MLSRLPIGELRFLYVGVEDTERDLRFYIDVMGAELRWRFQAFEADVAAVALGDGPLVVLADHRPTGSVLPIYAVPDVKAAVRELRKRGGVIQEGPLGTPEGDAIVAADPSGNQIALLQVDRPGAMDRAYADASNEHVVHESA
ncbi:MAG: VOC family protein [Chloroflexota bacterium]|nr:VOC family protein [Chloroflexota bacterium]